MNNSTRSEENSRKPFPLLRYFTITSLIAFVLVAISLVTFYRRIAINELIKVGESKNTAITQSFSNVIWPEFESFLGSASDLDADAIRAHPETVRLRQRLEAVDDPLSELLV